MLSSKEFEIVAVWYELFDQVVDVLWLGRLKPFHLCIEEIVDAVSLRDRLEFCHEVAFLAYYASFIAMAEVVADSVCDVRSIICISFLSFLSFHTTFLGPDDLVNLLVTMQF